MTRRITPYVVAFLLPLGFWGGLGVAGIGVYAAIHWRQLLRMNRGPMFATLPLGLITVLSAVIAVDTRGSILQAVGFLLLLTVGLQGVRLLVSHSDAHTIAIAFLAGVDFLAASVAFDYLFEVNRLPTGFFRDASLHNWPATIFAIAFPVALSTAGQRSGSRAFGVLSVLLMIAGVMTSLSWVGAIGLTVGAVVFYAAMGRACNAVRVVAAAAGVVALLAASAALLGLDEVRGFSVHSLKQVVDERAALRRMGVRLGTMRPWLGWGLAGRHTGLSRIPGLADMRRKLAEGDPSGTNLLLASEALDSSPWRTWHASIRADSAVAPDGMRTADLLVGAGVPGHRVYQPFRLPAGADASYTFSIWAKSSSPNAELALAVRDADGTASNIRHLSGGPGTDVVGNQAARLRPTNEWQRYWIAAEFATQPQDMAVAIVYLDGFFESSLQANEAFVWGAQVNVGPTPLAYSPVLETGSIVMLEAVAHFHNWFVQTYFESGRFGVFALLLMLVLLALPSVGTSSTVPAATIAALLAASYFDLAVAQASILTCAFMAWALGTPQPTNARIRQSS